MIIEAAKLDPIAFQYLKDVERTRGEGFHGVYAWQAPSKYRGKGWLRYVGGGCLLLVVALLLPRPDVLLNAWGWGEVGHACWRPGLVGIGGLLLWVGIRLLTHVV